MTAAEETATKKAATKKAATKKAAPKKSETKAETKKTEPKKTETGKAASNKTVEATGFSDAERAAMKERTEELRAAGRGGRKKADDANALLAKIAELDEPDRTLAERIHAIITTVAPELAPKTWYGMPAYAKDGSVLVFFQPAQKFDSRYATLGFNDPANLDDGSMWPTSYALTDLSDAEVKKIEKLVKQAVS